ncbi:hypothetical protein B0H34DRAFT_673438 [Crassisporium funariophilum]|nr:hypothetical protein B0H34DRAFT_673438 [Crassisporium funariophilum]
MNVDPLSLEGDHTPDQFYAHALKSGRSRNASAQITRTELLKDSRVYEHWSHKFLAFTVLRGKQEHMLYSRATDTLRFCKPGDERDIEKRAFANAGVSLKLSNFAQLLEHKSYSSKYAYYGLFSANCWAWSRGILFDLVRHPCATVAEVLKSNGGATSPMTPEELELCFSTEYGAYGRAVLHFASENARHPTFLHRYIIQATLMSYSVIHYSTRLKQWVVGPSNWTVCLRELLVYSDKTTDKQGHDHTFLLLPPNFISLVPVLPGYMDPSLPGRFCQRGQHLYLATLPMIKDRDMIALWANSHPGSLHTPQLASIKVVARRRDSVLNGLFALYVVWEAGRLAILGITNFSQVSLLCLPYCLNTYFEGWVWSNLTNFARAMHASITHLILPPNPSLITTYILSDFIQERVYSTQDITADILPCPLHSIELLHNITGQEEVVMISFSHQDVDYVLHLVGPSAMNAGWFHGLSMFWSLHRLERDTVKIFQAGNAERAARGIYSAAQILRITFKAGTEAIPEGSHPTLGLVVKLLQEVRDNYWWYYWLNARYWTWHWWLLRTILCRSESSKAFQSVEVEGRLCCLSRAPIILNDKYKQWKEAYIKHYGMERLSMRNLLFIFAHTRTIWVMFFIIMCAKVLDRNTLFLT